MISFFNRHKFAWLTFVLICASVYIFVRYIAHGNLDVFPQPWDILGLILYLIGWACISAAPYVLLVLGMKTLARKHWRGSAHDKVFNIIFGVIYAISIILTIFAPTPFYVPEYLMTVAYLVWFVTPIASILIYFISVFIPEKAVPVI